MHIYTLTVKIAPLLSKIFEANAASKKRVDFGGGNKFRDGNMNG